MKKLFKFVAIMSVFATVMFSTVAQAQTPSGIDLCSASLSQLSELSSNQIASLSTACEGAATNIPSADEVNKYAEIASAVAQAIGVAAKELGVAVNEFLATDAGLLVAVLIVWNIAGAAVFKIFVAIPVALLMWLLILRFIQKQFIQRYEKVIRKTLFGNEKEKIVPIYGAVDSESQLFFMAALTVVGFIFTLALFNIL